MTAIRGFKILLWIGFLAGTLVAQAQRVSASYKSGTKFSAAPWQVHDIIFNSPHAPAQPFEMPFGATWVGPGGETVTTPGFYNGNRQWVLRFSNGLPGSWQFTTFSTNPSLNGLKGYLQIADHPAVSFNSPLAINPANPQHFSYQNGKCHFLLAYELDWLFALDYGANSLARTRQMLGDLKAHGFNHIITNLYAYDVSWPISSDVPAHYFFGKPDYSPFGGSRGNPDFSQLNLDFFRHWDEVLDLLQTLGLDAHLMIYVWNKQVEWPPMYSEADNRFFDYVIRRFQAFPHVVWDVAKEALDYGRCDASYITERISRIRRLDAFKRLVTVHDYEYNARYPEQVDFVAIQSWRSQLHALMLQAWQKHADKPVVNIEHGGYESGPFQSFTGNYTSAETCLERAYECVFAGVYASYYWQNSAWNIVIWDALSGTHGYPKPRYDYYRHMSNLFTLYPYYHFRPSIPKLTTNDKGGNDNLASNGFALQSDQGIYLMLVPKEAESISVVLPQPVDGQVTLKWFHPFSGEFTAPETVEWRGWLNLSCPWPGTLRVLIVE